MKTKFGICNFCVPGTGVFAPRFVAEAGLDGMSIEFGTYAKGFPLSNRRLQDGYLEEQQEYAIQYPNIGLSDFDTIPLHAVHNDPLHEVAKGMFRSAIDAAAYMKVPLVFAPGFLNSEIRTNQEFERTVSMFQYACDLAGEKGILIGSENMLSAVKQRDLVSSVARKNFRLFYDSNNYFHFKGFDQVQVLAETYEFLAPQLHVKDGKKGELGCALLGRGDANFLGVMKELGKRDYNGWLIIENAYEQMPLRAMNEDVFEILHEDVAILKRAAAEVQLA